MTATARYCTVIAAGCHSGPGVGPIISRHRTYEAAVAKADRNDRLAVYSLSGGYPDKKLYIIPPQGDRRYGAGRYGNGLPR